MKHVLPQETLVGLLAGTEVQVETGVFGPRTEVELVHDGPVTLVLGSESFSPEAARDTLVATAIGYPAGAKERIL